LWHEHRVWQYSSTSSVQSQWCRGFLSQTDAQETHTQGAHKVHIHNPHTHTRTHTHTNTHIHEHTGAHKVPSTVPSSSALTAQPQHQGPGQHLDSSCMPSVGGNYPNNTQQQQHPQQQHQHQHQHLGGGGPYKGGTLGQQQGGSHTAFPGTDTKTPGQSSASSLTHITQQMAARSLATGVWVHVGVDVCGGGGGGGGGSGCGVRVCGSKCVCASPRNMLHKMHEKETLINRPASCDFKVLKHVSHHTHTHTHAHTHTHTHTHIQACV